MNPENIIISRTDGIGDVILTLPMAKLLRDRFPASTIAFLGKEYTKPVIRACTYVDQFISLNDFMNKKVLIAGKSPQCIIHVFPHKGIARKSRELAIPLRIGSRGKIFHWTTCNKLVKLRSRKTDLHEAQLNLPLLAPLGVDPSCSLPDISGFFGLDRIQPLSPALSTLIDHSKYNIILHPKSQGNSREWGLPNFTQLIQLLDQRRFKIFLSGTEADKIALQPLLAHNQDLVTDMSGKMDLFQFMSFIKNCDGLLAHSTGPLHIAAAMGKDAYGLYPPIHPLDPGRWSPLGKGAKVFVADKSCKACKSSPAACRCMSDIDPLSVIQSLEESYRQKFNP